MIPCLNVDKESLKEIMKREIVVIRSLLTSLHDEHEAILEGNENLFEAIMDERIGIVSSFEEYSEKLVAITLKLAQNVKLDIPECETLRHIDAIHLLDSCLDSEDFELTFLRDQIDALIIEVFHQNDVNAYLLNSNPLLNRKKPVYQELKVHAKAKITVAVLDR